MLTHLKEEQFDQYIDFAYALALDPARSGYSAYFDGIKTREDFIESAKFAMDHPDRGVLLYHLDGQVEGWIQYYILPEDRYAGLSACCIRRGTADALSEVTAYLSERCPGYEFSPGFPAANREAAAYLESAGFRKIEETNHYQIFFSQYTPAPDPEGVERVTEAAFEKFARVHRKIERNMYWNTERVRADLSSWDLFIAEENGVAAELMVNHESDGFYVVFALESEDGLFHEELSRNLLVYGMNSAKRDGAAHLTCFVEPDSGMNKIFREMNFQLIGGYVAYQKRI